MKRLALLVLASVVMFLTGCGGSQEAVSPATASPEVEATPTPTPTPISIPLLDTSKEYMAVIETEKGNLTLELYAGDAPVTVSNFVHLASQGFYDDITFYRVIPGFMAQSGDPTGTGTGGCGYFIPDEFSERTHVTGALSMANRGLPDSGGSQFFITYTPQHHLDGRHSVFGLLVEGMDVLQSLTPRDPAQNPDYQGDRIISITVYTVE